MGTVRTDKFRNDAVRIALSSKDQKMIREIIFPEDGLSRKQIAEDLGYSLIDLQNQNKTVAARAMAERNTFGHLP